MIGRQEIHTTRAFTHEELLEFMSERWDSAEYNSFITDPIVREYTKRYVVLPATPRYLIIVYSRAAGGLFNKHDKVILSIANSPVGASNMILRSIPTKNIFAGAAKIADTMSEKAEREGPTEEILQRYTAYMRSLLEAAGYLKK